MTGHRHTRRAGRQRAALVATAGATVLLVATGAVAPAVPGAAISPEQSPSVPTAAAPQTEPERAAQVPRPTTTQLQTTRAAEQQRQTAAADAARAARAAEQQRQQAAAAKAARAARAAEQQRQAAAARRAAAAAAARAKAQAARPKTSTSAGPRGTALTCHAGAGAASTRVSPAAIGNAGNAYRTRRGLPALTVSGSSTLQNHARDMAAWGKIWHSGRDNIVGCVRPAQAAGLVRAWAASPAHAAQLRREDVRSMTIGSVVGDGLLYGAVAFR